LRQLALNNYLLAIASVSVLLAQGHGEIGLLNPGPWLLTVING
jgi:hypothetical protein